MPVSASKISKRPHAHDALADQLLKIGHETHVPGLGPLPTSAEVASLIELFVAAFFPVQAREIAGAAGKDVREQLIATLTALETQLREAVFLGLHRQCVEIDDCQRRARAIVKRTLAGLPRVRATLLDDVQAALDGDPAATGADEVIACYPGLHAIAVYRAAHLLLGAGATVLPRMLTEHAKSRTGIDIHPGARIGPSLFIDHGTGIVIGETTDIGRGVRIYQGVTLGALSIKRRDAADERRWRDKRHPTIEDDVVIYANATILGGGTVIGKGAAIGGNAFITYSVPPGTRVGVGR